MQPLTRFAQLRNAFPLILALLICCGAWSPVLADDSEFFNVQTVVGDGSDGRIYRKWEQQIHEERVRSVEVTLQRKSGSKDTYVNLRFGDGMTFENGKRVQLGDSSERTVSWNVDGRKPEGKPLVLNAYKGEVEVRSVRVHFMGGDGSRLGGSQPRPIPRPKPIRPADDVDYSGSGSDSHFGGQHSGQQSAGSGDDAARDRCRYARYQRPRIEIDEVKDSGGLFSGKYKVRGSISAACVEEAGYYERGKLKERIEFPLDDRFQRQEFEVKVKSGKGGELRVLTSDGSDDRIDIDDALVREKKGLF